MKANEIRYDCLHFRGHIPCIPNKEKNEICGSCNSYIQVGKRILIIKLGALGDVIRTTPLVVKYRKMYPNCHISWITLSPNILPKNKIDKIYKYDYTSLIELRNMSFDIAINLDKEPEACILLKDVNAKEKLGFSWNEGHIVPANKNAEHKLLTGLFDQLSQQNTKSYPQEIFDICGLEFNHEEYMLDVNLEWDEKWNTIFADKAKGKKVIGLNTGCGERWLTRLWEPSNWIQLIKNLKESGFYPVVLGGEAEDEINKMYSTETGCYYPGTYSLQEFIAITNNCDIIVSAVSMMMHIAVGLRKPLVLFNNIFNKYEFDLYGRGIIVEPDSGCECFYGNTCKREIHCMQTLKTDTVFEAVKKLNTNN